MKTVYKNYNDEEMITRDRIAASITQYIDSASKKKRLKTVYRASKLILPKTLWKIETDWDNMRTVQTLYPLKVIKCIGVDITPIPKAIGV